VTVAGTIEDWGIIDVRASLDVKADLVDAGVDCPWDGADEGVSDRVEEESFPTLPGIGVGVTFEVGEVDGGDLDLIVDEGAAVDVTDTDPILLGEFNMRVSDVQRVNWSSQVYPMSQQPKLQVGPIPQASSQTGLPREEVQATPKLQHPPLPSRQLVWPAGQTKTFCWMKIAAAVGAGGWCSPARRSCWASRKVGRAESKTLIFREYISITGIVEFVFYLIWRVLERKEKNGVNFEKDVYGYQRVYTALIR